MKRLFFLVLLSSAVLLGSAGPVWDTVTCTQNGVAAAAQMAIHNINKNHHHGYKFRLNETEGNTVEKVGEGCNIELQLELLETKCHIVNPKYFEDCPLREQHAREVRAHCNVTITVKNGDANVTKYVCDTRQVKTNIEMVSICSDCPTLLPLNDTEGLKSVNEAVNKFNQNTTNKHYYILKEVGRISSGHIMTTEMNYYTEFALVETHCPMGSRIIPEACIPLCPDRAHHAFCRSSYSSANGLGSTDCEFYPPLNTTELAPGEKERMCRHPHHHHHHHGHRPPPHAHDHGLGPPPHGHGPPPHAHDHGLGPPPHGHGPPPHAHDRGHGPPPHAHDRGHGPPPHTHGPPPHAHDRGHGPPPHTHGPPPHAHGHLLHKHDQDQDQGPPSHGRGHGPPTSGRGHGPPPHGDGQGSPPGHKKWHHHKFFQPCHGFLTYVDPALHPICPWPFPEHHHKPRPSQS